MYLAIRLAKYKFVGIIAAAAALSLLLAPTFAQAVAGEGQGNANNNNRAGVCPDGDPFCVTPVEQNLNLGNRGLQETVSGVINVALSLLGIVAVVIVLIGGFKWMTAGGSEDKVAEARKLIFSGIIGLAIIMSAWAIARFVIVQLAEQTAVPDFDVQ